MFAKRMVLILGLVFSFALASTTAQAGCGCDHPPPDWAEIMPPFASKGKWLTVHAIDGVFSVGETYTVAFGPATRDVVATVDSQIEVKLPGGVPVGPTAVHVTGPGYDHVHDDALLTVMSKPRKIKNRGGFFDVENYKAAIGRDGTLYMALDLKNVADPLQFMMAFLDLSLAYGPEDVVIYNADGIDLTLFTAAVEDTTVRQWGSYYGWDVEGDSGIVGTYYDSQTTANANDVAAGMSNIFTYWRHEFNTYNLAHATGGTHEVEPTNGLHPDGTRHIDHSNLVIAIRGQERSATDPFDATLFTPLAPGMREVHLGWVSFQVEAPIEIADISVLMDDAEGPLGEMLEEVELLDD